MMTAASPMTMAPRPMSMVALPWYWASKAPDRATRPLESIRPSTLVVSVLIPWARDMLELEPVARRAQPSSVPKNQYSTAMTAATKSASRNRGLFSPAARICREDTSKA